MESDDKPMVTVLNKIDRMDENEVKRLAKEFKNAVPISALKKINFQTLIDKIVLHLNSVIKLYTISLPQNKASLVSLIHREGHVIRKEYRGNTVFLEAQLPVILYEKIKKQITSLS